MIEKVYDIFIIFLIIIKILYYITYIYYLICKIYNIDNYFIHHYIILITLNTIFNTSMAILLLYIFNPFYKTKEITNYVKIFLFAFSFILLIQNFQFINENNLVKIIREVFNIK
jgi:hypothetical protein